MPSLAATRAAAGLSQGGLAARSGVSKATITRIECGRTRPTPRVVARLSAALGARPEAIEEFRPLARRMRLPSPAVRAALPHVFVVDAGQAVHNPLRDLLAAQGYRVSTGDLADMDVVAIAGLAPDLIVLDDISANEDTGRGLLRQLRTDAHTEGIPVVILCACPRSEAEELEQHLAELGIRVVTQPFKVGRGERRP